MGCGEEADLAVGEAAQRELLRRDHRRLVKRSEFGVEGWLGIVGLREG